MRVRLMLVILLLFAVTALAVPLALSLADRRTSELAAERDRQATALADESAVIGAPLQQVVDRYYDVYGEGVVVVDADRKPLAAPWPHRSDPGVSSALDHALVDAPTSRSFQDLALGSAPRSGHRGCASRRRTHGAVVTAVDTSVAARGIAIAWLWVGVGVLVFLILAELVARSAHPVGAATAERA